MNQRPIGFVGLGLMGSPMAHRLLDRGFHLVVYNRTASKAVPLEARGAKLAASPAALAHEASLIALMVSDGNAVLSLLQGSDGLLPKLAAGTTVVNFSTVGLQASLEIAGLVRSTGADYLDAPVLGSIGPARSGELLIFVGGEDAGLERCRPVLESLAKRIYALGPVGRGSGLKLITNMLLARYVEALGEVLTLADSFQLDPRQVLEILQSSALASPMWKKGEVLLDGRPPLHFPLRHMAKDLRLLDEEVERLGLGLPGHEAVSEIYQEAANAGMGDLDYSEIYEFLRPRADRR